MKRQRLTLLMAALLTAMAGNAQDIELHVTGKAPAKSKMIYIQTPGTSEWKDSVKVVDGKFEYSSKEPRNAFIYIVPDVDGPNLNNFLGLTILNDGVPVNIDFTNNTLTGSPDNEAFCKIQKADLDMVIRQVKVAKKYFHIKKDGTVEVDEIPDSVYEMGQKDHNDLEQQVLKYIQDNKSFVSPAYYIGRNYEWYGYSQLKTIIDSTAAYYHHPLVKPAIERFDSLANRFNSLLSKSDAVPYTDFKMQTDDGKTVCLSQYVGNGHYTLVDFWASWCGPCRKEMPNVVAAYNRYHDSKGFEVVGVSLDDNAESWKKAIKELALPWPQISDLKGWDSDVVDIYQIKGIPENLLIDPDGKIVARNLRGEDLEFALKKIYGEQP